MSTSKNGGWKVQIWAKTWNFPLYLKQEKVVTGCVFGCGRKTEQKNGEKCCAPHLSVSQRTYLHVCVCTTAASPDLHTVDMTNIKQMVLIPQSTLRLPVSLASVHVCCLSSDCFIAVVPCVCSWQCVHVCVAWVHEGKWEYLCRCKAEV